MKMVIDAITSENEEKLELCCHPHTCRCTVGLARLLQHDRIKEHSWNLCHLPWETSHHRQWLLRPGMFSSKQAGITVAQPSNPGVHFKSIVLHRSSEQQRS